MKIIITIDWHTKVRPAIREELATYGTCEAWLAMDRGDVEGEINYTDNKGRDYNGWWKRKIIVD